MISDNKKELIRKIDDLIYHADDISGYRLFRELQKEGVLNNLEPDLAEAVVKLQFLNIPSVTDKEAAAIVSRSLTVALYEKELDLVERITKKLLLIDLTERDGYKAVVKNALANCAEQVTEKVMTAKGRELSSVSDWIKDYLSNVELNSNIALQKAAYYYGQPHYLKLQPEEKEALKKLFDLYKFLNTTSFSPEGFEDDLLMVTKDGKQITTKKGRIVVLSDPKKPMAFTQNIDYGHEGILESGKEPKYKKTSEPDKNLLKPDDNLRQLKEMAESYPVGSLERRAIEEEIEKLEKEAGGE